MKIEFTKDELITLNKLLDIALKAEGINVVQPVLYFVTKFNEALNGKVENIKNLKASKAPGKDD